MSSPFNILKFENTVFAQGVLSDEDLANADQQTLKSEALRLVLEWGLQHGIWCTDPVTTMTSTNVVMNIRSSYTGLLTLGG